MVWAWKLWEELLNMDKKVMRPSDSQVMDTN